jgi:hypothetical protein
VRLLSDTRTASLFETRWTTRVKLRSGDRLHPGLEVKTRKPSGDLPTVKHPTVGLIDMGKPHHPTADRPDLDVAERFTVSPFQPGGVVRELVGSATG